MIIRLLDDILVWFMRSLKVQMTVGVYFECSSLKHDFQRFSMVCSGLERGLSQILTSGVLTILFIFMR